jgi:hypothetical protein
MSALNKEGLDMITTEWDFGTALEVHGDEPVDDGFTKQINRGRNPGQIENATQYGREQQRADREQQVRAAVEKRLAELAAKQQL